MGRSECRLQAINRRSVQDTLMIVKPIQVNCEAGLASEPRRWVHVARRAKAGADGA